MLNQLKLNKITVSFFIVLPKFQWSDMQLFTEIILNANLIDLGCIPQAPG